MGKSSRIRSPKPCDDCGAASHQLFRVKTQQTIQWRLVCKSCQTIAASNCNYQYGGTWKTKKRN